MTEEDERRQTIRLRLARLSGRPDQTIPTGFTTLDHALGSGGLPRGALVELFGPSDSGKTTLALQIVAHVQRAGMTAGWIDAEHSFDPTYAAAAGVAMDQLPVAQPESAEQAFEIARRLAASDSLDLLVIDSAAALVPNLELAAGLGEPGPGLHSRVLSSGLRRLSAALARTATLIVFLNQTRVRRDASGQEIETSAGGASLKLHAAVRIELSRVASTRVRFRVLKNKMGTAFGEGELRWKQGAGFAETP